MMKAIGKLLAAALGYVAVGACIMLGAVTIQWLVPKPEQRLLVCFYQDLEELECRPFATEKPEAK